MVCHVDKKSHHNGRRIKAIGFFAALSELKASVCFCVRSERNRINFQRKIKITFAKPKGIEYRRP